MKKELVKFIHEQGLSPFLKRKTPLNILEESIFKTKDAKAIHSKVLTHLSTYFTFADTSNIFRFFSFSTQQEVIKKRQAYFSSIPDHTASYLSHIQQPKPFWRPRYGIIAVTEDEKTFMELKKMDIAVRFLITQSDLESLDEYDIVQVIDCEQFSRVLETLPQTVFVDSIEEIYLERFLTQLSGWKTNLTILVNQPLDEEMRLLVEELSELARLVDEDRLRTLTKEEVEAEQARLNEMLSTLIKSLTISGETLFSMLRKSTLPEELLSIVRETLAASRVPRTLFKRTIPLELDEEELDRTIKQQNTQQHTSLAKAITKRAHQLRTVPDKLQRLSELLLLSDFNSGMAAYKKDANHFPDISETLSLNEARNLFLEEAQPITFYLTNEHRCSILTGANSGGKTTLLEHLLQLVTLSQLGLPLTGTVTLPLFNKVYYFAKTKGSLNKGAFETLLTQLATIDPDSQTLLLADEIEAVTEPGVAGAIVGASAEFFITKGCYIVIATHLGKEIQKILPKGARIDGIEAKGLDEHFELIVDHNPVLGRLAHSTPELIIEKMASSQKQEYFSYLYDFIKKQK